MSEGRAAVFLSFFLSLSPLDDPEITREGEEDCPGTRWINGPKGEEAGRGKER